MQIHHFPRMQSEDDTRRIHEFLDTAPKEVLIELHRLVEAIFTAPNSEISSIYYLGVIGTTIKIKYNCCTCGVDHDQEALDKAAKALAEGRPAEDGNFVKSAFITPTGRVVPLSLEPGTGRIRCDGEFNGEPCGMIFADIQERFTAKGDGSPACPRCGAGE